MSFIVHRPTVETSFKLDRIQGPARVNSFRFVQYKDGADVANGTGA
jgi:hypothetical protein